MCLFFFPPQNRGSSRRRTEPVNADEQDKPYVCDSKRKRLNCAPYCELPNATTLVECFYIFVWPHMRHCSFTNAGRDPPLLLLLPLSVSCQLIVKSKIDQAYIEHKSDSGKKYGKRSSHIFCTILRACAENWYITMVYQALARAQDRIKKSH